MAHAHSCHDHPHGAAHHHDGGEPGSGGNLLFALLLTGGFALVEAVAGWWSGSLALLSDAGHMATDAAALAVALVAQRVAQRPPSREKSYGYARAEVLGAFVNALAMLGIVVWIGIEAVSRLLTPTPVAAGAVIAVAVAGLAVNLLVAWRLSRGGSLNQRAALLHVMGDLLGSVVAIVAGVVIQFTGWLPIDPLLSLVVALLILRSTWVLLRQAGDVLMESVPGHLSYDEVGQSLSSLPGVLSVHDLHIWAMGADRVALSAHLVIGEPQAWPELLAAARQNLELRFGIDHATLQPSWAVLPKRGRVIALVAQNPDRRAAGENSG
ncbi:Cadmium, cobalt and zinc/H(+)-K(+) antiporter [Burkholderiales bacterium]|nr:Cadmium, cobalt and zinc/H(+)-K(+) antiporter [Burkholderiales bacterium]